MGMVTLHLVIGVGVFLMPLFLLLFSTLAIPEFEYLYGKLAPSYGTAFWHISSMVQATGVAIW